MREYQAFHILSVLVGWLLLRWAFSQAIELVQPAYRRVRMILSQRLNRSIPPLVEEGYYEQWFGLFWGMGVILVWIVCFRWQPDTLLLWLASLFYPVILSAVIAVVPVEILTAIHQRKYGDRCITDRLLDQGRTPKARRPRPDNPAILHRYPGWPHY